MIPKKWLIGAISCLFAVLTLIIVFNFGEEQPASTMTSESASYSDTSSVNKPIGTFIEFTAEHSVINRSTDDKDIIAHPSVIASGRTSARAESKVSVNNKDSILGRWAQFVTNLSEKKNQSSPGFSSTGGSSSETTKVEDQNIDPYRDKEYRSNYEDEQDLLVENEHDNSPDETDKVEDYNIDPSHEKEYRSNNIDEQDLQIENSLDELPEQKLDGHYVISGRVLNQVGKPIPDIELIAMARQLFVETQEDTPTSTRLRPAHTTSDYAGHYAFDQLPNGEYFIRTLSTSQYPAAETVVRAGVDFADLMIVDQQPLQISGFISGVGNEPISGVMVTPLYAGARGTKSDDAGRFVLMLTLKQDVRGLGIRFMNDGYQTRDVRLSAADLEGTGGLLSLDIALEPYDEMTTVAGTVHDDAGVPVVGETVRLYSQRLRKAYTAVTGEQGEFDITNVILSTDYQLQINPKSSYSSYIQPNIEITSYGEPLDIVLMTQDVATISGQMLDIAGSPIPRFSLNLRNKTSQTMLQVTGDEQGYFVLGGVAEGELVFETSAMPHFTVRGVQLSEGDDIPVLLRLDVGTHLVKGRVVDEDDNLIAASEVILTWTHVEDGATSQATRRTRTDVEGNFMFSGVGPGVHTIQTDVDGYKRANLRHNVAGDTGKVELRLEKFPDVALQY